MTWVIFSLLGAVGTAVYFALIKKMVTKVPQAIVASIIHLITGVILFVVSFFSGAQISDARFYSAATVTIVLNIIATHLLFSSLKVLELSVSAALFTLSPFVLLISSYLLLHEIPSVMGFLGIVLTVFGLYELNLERRQHWLDPFRKLLFTPALRTILIVVILFGISSAFDKQTVLYAGPYLSSAIVTTFIGLGFLVIARATPPKKMLSVIHKNLSVFLIAALLLTMSSIVLNIAMSLQLASYVLTLKRLSVIVSMVLGVYFFNEKISKHKVLGIVLTWLGSICIILG